MIISPDLTLSHTHVQTHTSVLLVGSADERNRVLSLKESVTYPHVTAATTTQLNFTICNNTMSRKKSHRDMYNYSRSQKSEREETMRQ